MTSLCEAGFGAHYYGLAGKRKTCQRCGFDSKRAVTVVASVRCKAEYLRAGYCPPRGSLALVLVGSDRAVRT